LGVKWVVESLVALGKSIPLIPGVVGLTYTNNPGGAFGTLAGQAPLLLTGGFVAVIVTLWILSRAKPSRSMALGFGLILGGTACNLLDRLLGGQVTDYFHFFYVFNAADFAIIGGVGVLFVAVVRSLGREAQGQSIDAG
jgi:signal peptidase II